MSDPAPPRRRWLRYSLRTGFLILTMLCVWLGSHMQWMQNRKKALEWVKSQDVNYLDYGYWDDQHYSNNLCLEFDGVPGRCPIVERCADAPWSLRIFGEKG